MAGLQKRLIDGNFNPNALAPQVNATIGGQMGPMVNQGAYIQNAAYIRKNVIAKVVSFPRWVEYMDSPNVYREAIKAFFEVHSKIDGLNKSLTAEFAEQSIGAGGHRQYDLTKVLETQSDITHTVTDKYGQVYRDLFDFWLRYGMQDPIAQVPLVSIINDSVEDALPDLYCATILYFEPCPLHKKVQNAWLCTNMAPRMGVTDEGRKDLESAGDMVEAGIGFTSLQTCSWAVNQWAQEEFDKMNREGLNPMTRESYITAIDADVNATKVGYFDMAEDLSKQQI